MNAAQAARAPPVATSPQQPKQQPIAAAAATKAVTPNNAKYRQNDQNLKEIRERQRLFKEAAIEAKKKGEDKVAVLYLKNAKGFDQMILAAENGLPVDMANVCFF